MYQSDRWRQCIDIFLIYSSNGRWKTMPIRFSVTLPTLTSVCLRWILNSEREDLFVGQNTQQMLTKIPNEMSIIQEQIFYFLKWVSVSVCQPTESVSLLTTKDCLLSTSKVDHINEIFSVQGSTLNKRDELDTSGEIHQDLATWSFLTKMECYATH